MGSFKNSYESCINVADWLRNEATLFPQCNETHKWENVNSVYSYCELIYDSEVLGGSYSKPMLWIGIYIAVASLFCILPMAADLLHGFRNKKLWFPCKYFTLNTASITVIQIAMKLPVDLNNPMPGNVDQFAKLGSLAFMCTMMANLMPSLASMDDKELFANVTGLVILVITMVVNVLIQVQTGLLGMHYFVYIYVVIMLYLLIISVSFALTTPTTKGILELKYQATHKKASNDEHPGPYRMSTVEELVHHVRRYWIMAGICSPQFVIVSTPLCSAAGIVCVFSSLNYFYLLVLLLYGGYNKDFKSDYKWSLVVVLITQIVGVAVGTIAPIFRSFTILSFKLSIAWSRNHVKVCKVEKYWTRMLSEWKKSRLPFPSSGLGSKTLVNKSKNLILSLCIGFQIVLVVSCKMIGLIPIGVVKFVGYCSYCWKSLMGMFIARSSSSSRYTEQERERNDTVEAIRNYALLLEVELSKRTTKGISNSMNRLVQKAEKKSPNYLLKLLETSTGFEGVGNFDCDQFQYSEELVNSWSLPVITLTCVAIVLPNIQKDIVDSLFKSVDEGISYIHLVDETINTEAKFVNVQKAAMSLWYEVEDNKKWLGNTLQRKCHKGKTPKQILEWFADKAKKTMEEFNKRNINEEPLENTRHELIVANSMYRITKTIILNYENNVEQLSENKLFSLLSGMIADIVGACLTNLPRAIKKRCEESVIEKREASVEAAAKVLYRTKEILNKIQVHKLPSLDHDHMAFIDEWHVHLKQSSPFGAKVMRS